MLAKELLIDCLNCKNNVNCWGLNRKFNFDGKNPKEINISIDAYSKNLKKLDVDSLHKAQVTASMIFVRTMFLQPVGMNEIVKDILQTSMCVIEALTNSSNAEWECPPEWNYIPKDA